MSNESKLNSRALELMQPIQRQIMMCDDNTDLSLFAVGMLRKAINLLDLQYTKEEDRKSTRLNSSH